MLSRMGITGRITLKDESEFACHEIFYQPLLAYNIKALRNLGCDQVHLIDPNRTVSKEIIWKYDLVQNESTQSEDDVIVSLNGLNPLMSSALLLKSMEQRGQSILFVDCFGNTCGEIIQTGSPMSKVILGLEHGFAVTSLDKFKMISGLLVDHLKPEDYPEVVQDAYQVKNAGTPGKPKLLFSAPYSFFIPELVEEIEANFDVTYAYKAPISVVRQLLHECDVWMVSTCPPYYMGEDLFKLAPNLKLVATPSTGTNHLDAKCLIDNEIGLRSIKESPVINEISASFEMSLTLLLAMIKNLNVVTDASKFGVWREQEVQFRSKEFQGMTVGLIGLGRIGLNMARYCTALKMNVIYFDPEVQTDLYERTFNLNALLGASDIVSLHYHLNDQTKNSFGRAQFDLMKSGSYFLNTARGELVDELVLIEKLRDGHIKAAAVDVISDEHLNEKWNHPMIRYARENSNLIVSPHVAGLTIQSESKAMADLIKQVKKFVDENF